MIFDNVRESDTVWVRSFCALCEIKRDTIICEHLFHFTEDDRDIILPISDTVKE